MTAPLNREQKRSKKKEGDSADASGGGRRNGGDGGNGGDNDNGDGDDTGRSGRPRKAGAKGAVAAKEQRTTARVFVKEMRGELRKVAWPSRKETFQYSGVVAFTLVILTTLIFILDYAFQEVVLRLFNVK